MVFVLNVALVEWALSLSQTYFCSEFLDINPCFQRHRGENLGQRPLLIFFRLKRVADVLEHLQHRFAHRKGQGECASCSPVELIRLLEALLVDLHKKEAYKHRQEEYALKQVLKLAQVPKVHSPVYLLNTFLLLAICPLPNTDSLVEECGLLWLNFLVFLWWLDQLYANHRLIVP